MQIFYAPDIRINPELPEEEAGHCVRVLRLSEGDEILVADGKGEFHQAVIRRAHPKHCEVEILKSWSPAPLWPAYLHIAVAPTKNMDRMEWFAEKATEIGIDAITFLCCQFSERREIKTARIEKILVSAMKQSQKAMLPKLNDMTDFRTFVQLPFGGQKFIAESLTRVAALRAEIEKRGERAIIEVDGGITLANVRQVREAGVNLAVAGSSVYGASDPAAAIRALREA